MATNGEGFGDVKMVWIVLQWFFGGLVTLIGAAIMALIGNLWKEHRMMKEDYDKRNSDAVKELKASQKKEYEDVITKYNSRGIVNLCDISTRSCQ